MRRVLITGVGGFVGSHLAESYFQDGWNVDGIAPVFPEAVTFLDRFLAARLPDAGLDSFIKENPPDLCIHCAGSTSIEASNSDPKADFDSSVAVTFGLCESLRKFAPHTRLIFLSSAAVYGNPESLPVDEGQRLEPISCYGYHKQICEVILKEYFQIHRLRSNVVRIFSAYGPGLKRQVVWDTCRKLAKQEGFLLRGTGAETRDFIHVKDVIAGIKLVANCGVGDSSAYNLASGRGTKIADLLQILSQYFGRITGPGFDGNVPPGSPLYWCADMSRLEAVGFKPRISLELGLKDFVKWFVSEDF